KKKNKPHKQKTPPPPAPPPPPPPPPPPKLSVFSLLGLSISSFCIPLCIGAVTQPSMSLARLTSRNILLWFFT
ncbi:MAG: hypothetical protein ACK5CR_06870, partial [Pseudanabaena sp.]